MMVDPHGVLDSLRAAGPRPRLMWENEGERLELSGHVTANWAIKIANLLLDEADAAPGTIVLLDLPVHWRTVTWALGTWLTGATVAVPGDSPGTDAAGIPPIDVVATTRPDQCADLAEVVAAVPLASFALRWPGELPGHVLDGAADVAAQPDRLGPVAPGGSAQGGPSQVTCVPSPLEPLPRGLTAADVLAWGHTLAQGEPLRLVG